MSALLFNRCSAAVIQPSENTEHCLFSFFLHIYTVSWTSFLLGLNVSLLIKVAYSD